MSKLNRRDFLKLSGGSVAATGAVVAAGGLLAPGSVDAATGRTTLPYEPKVIGRAKEFKSGVPVTFSFPDSASPCALIKVGERVPQGIGPNGDIVAFSTLCTHMGCPVIYDSEARAFKCPCHFSVFDPELEGQMICGQATENLPRIVLEYNTSNDSVTAVAVDGLIYGRQSNIL